MSKESFMLGDWVVQEPANLIRRDHETQSLEPLVMSVLVALCEAPGEVVSADDLLKRCWKDAAVGDNPVHKSIAILRRALGDNANEPRYIETIRKKGYRTVAAVQSATVTNAGSWTDGSPFLGLASFSAEHAAVFFGRSRAVEKLLGSVVRIVGSGRELLLILGPSGSGKTSLVQAGLLPALARPDSPVRMLSATALDLADIGSQNPFTAIASAMLDWEVDEQPVFAGRSADSLGRSLLESPAIVDTEIAQALRNHPQARFVLFLDRLEVLFTNASVDEGGRWRLLGLLDRLANSAHVLVITACRNDFYPQLAAEPILMANKERGGHFDVAPPTRAELAQMIRLPAVAAGLSFGLDADTHARVDDLLVESAATSPDALPLLQYTLHELYCQRSTAGELRAATLSQLGGLEGAIGQRAEAVIAQLSAAERQSLSEVLSLLVTLVDDDTVTSQRASWSALRTDEQRHLVSTLVEQRLFVSTLVGDAPGFGVAHEALLRRWPRVSDWIASHRQALHLRGRLAAQAARWIDDQRSADLLLPAGKQLAGAVELLRNANIPLGADTVALIEASQRRSTRLLRMRQGVLVSVIALALLASGLGFSALHAKRLAEQRRNEAEGLMGFMVGDFANKLKPLGRLDLLDDIDDEALKYLQGESLSDTSALSRLQHAQTLQTIAEVERSRGDQARALQALTLADQLLQINLVKGSADGALLKALGGVNFWIGQLKMEHGDYEAARHYFEAYLAYSTRMRSLAPADRDAMLEVAYANYDLAELAIRQNEPAAASGKYQIAAALESQVLALDPGNHEVQAELAKSIGQEANAEEVLGHLSGANREYHEQIASLEKLIAAAPTEVRWITLLANARYYLGHLLFMQGEVQAARQEFAQALSLQQDALDKSGGNKIWERGALLYEYSLASVDDASGASDRALLRLRRVDTNIDALLQVDAAQKQWTWLAIQIRLEVATALFMQKDFAAAQAMLDKAKALMPAADQQKESERRETIPMADALLLENELFKAAGKQQDAVHSCDEARTLLAVRVPASSDYQLLDRWVRANLCSGRAADVRTQMAFLDSIGYRNPVYVSYLSQHAMGMGDNGPDGGASASNEPKDSDPKNRIARSR